MHIDINCDMGEGMLNDKALMPFISSANIACGYHAGDEDTIKQTITYCLENNVAIGAHPGFKDKANFGRIPQHLSDCELYDLVAEQINIVKNICTRMGATLHHVKPHGALYNMAAVDAGISYIIANAIKEIDNNLILYGLSNSYLITEAKANGLKTANEIFADRTYQPDGTLTPRNMHGALIKNDDDALEQVLMMIEQKKVKTLTGELIPIKADTICIHGDGEHALSFAQQIYSTLQNKCIDIQTIL
jgi:UPF0271 protein